MDKNVIWLITVIRVGVGSRESEAEQPAVCYIEVGIVNDDLQLIGCAETTGVIGDVDEGEQTSLVLGRADARRHATRVRHEVVVGKDKRSAETSINQSINQSIIIQALIIIR